MTFISNKKIFAALALAQGPLSLHSVSAITANSLRGSYYKGKAWLLARGPDRWAAKATLQREKAEMYARTRTMMDFFGNDDFFPGCFPRAPGPMDRHMRVPGARLLKQGHVTRGGRAIGEFLSASPESLWTDKTITLKEAGPGLDGLYMKPHNDIGLIANASGLFVQQREYNAYSEDKKKPLVPIIPWTKVHSAELVNVQYATRKSTQTWLQIPLLKINTTSNKALFFQMNPGAENWRGISTEKLARKFVRIIDWHTQLRRLDPTLDCATRRAVVMAYGYVNNDAPPPDASYSYVNNAHLSSLEQENFHALAEQQQQQEPGNIEGLPSPLTVGALRVELGLPAGDIFMQGSDIARKDDCEISRADARELFFLPEPVRTLTVAGTLSSRMVAETNRAHLLRWLFHTQLRKSLSTLDCATRKAVKVSGMTGALRSYTQETADMSDEELRNFHRLAAVQEAETEGELTVGAVRAELQLPAGEIFIAGSEDAVGNEDKITRANAGQLFFIPTPVPAVDAVAPMEQVADV